MAQEKLIFNVELSGLRIDHASYGLSIKDSWLKIDFGGYKFFKVRRALLLYE
jgi:hypothetical protein